MNTQKEVEYIAEIARLKVELKHLSGYALTIEDINKQLNIINESGVVLWEVDEARNEIVYQREPSTNGKHVKTSVVIKSPPVIRAFMVNDIK